MNLDHPIHIETEFEALEQYIAKKKPSQIVVVMDETAEKLCLPLIGHVIPEDAHPFVLGSEGEDVKRIENAHALWSGFEDVGVDRSSLVIALGGGSVTDLVGFAAGTYMRGVACWLVPTTLLAMVDAAIGGKTGINLGGAKNRVGSFSAPVGVSICGDFMPTLSARAIRSGYAEHQKHYLISKATELEKTARWVGPDAGLLAETVGASAEVKMSIVREDPLEQKARGGRAVLNFGHTAGHALESWAMGAGEDLTHGEAVAWGLRVALELSAIVAERAGDAEGSWATQDKIAGALREEAAHLAVAIPCPASLVDGAEAVSDADLTSLWTTMERDKKSRGGRVRWVLLEQVGVATAGHEVGFKEFRKAVEAVQLGR